MKFKTEKLGKIIVKEVPEAFGGPYIPEQRRRDLSRFVMSEESLEAIERQRKRRRVETEELLADLGFAPRKPWWEDF